MPERPQRISIPDETGRPVTLAEGPQAFMQISTGRRIVFLGLGPRPGEFPGKIRRGKPTYWMEAPELVEALDGKDGNWLKSLPATFRRIGPDDLTPDFIRSSTIFVYRQNLKLFPSFWGPVLARCKLAASGKGAAPTTREVWLPGSERDLLTRELEQAFEAEGFRVRRLGSEPSPSAVLELLRERRPRLFFSVNFRGLDPLGEVYHLLREEDVEVAAWCVDNPFHILSNVRSNYWTGMHIYVTDDWFLPKLRELGGTRVRHLPLAAGLGPGRGAVDGSGSVGRGGFDPALGLERRLVFVGRSSFPARSRFFAGQRVDQELLDVALRLLDKGKRPHFGWWMEETGTHPAWPGTEVRGAGLSAEETARSWRAMCLGAAARPDPAGRLDGATVFGDPAWHELVPGLTDIRPEVDYYGPLADIYARSGVSLNLTSLLLPHGLTQRHFDVWAAGGFLITDATPGMRLFPPDLAEPVAFRRPEEITDLAARFMPGGGGSPGGPGREELRTSWHRHILAEHTYGVRVRSVLADVFGS